MSNVTLIILEPSMVTVQFVSKLCMFRKKLYFFKIFCLLWLRSNYIFKTNERPIKLCNLIMHKSRVTSPTMIISASYINFRFCSKLTTLVTSRIMISFFQLVPQCLVRGKKNCSPPELWRMQDLYGRFPYPCPF